MGVGVRSLLSGGGVATFYNFFDVTFERALVMRNQSLSTKMKMASLFQAFSSQHMVYLSK